MKSNSQSGNFPGGNSSRDDKHWVNAVQRVRVALWSSYRDTSASPHLSMNRHAVWQCGALSTNQQQIVDRRQRGRKMHLQHIKDADHDDILTALHDVERDFMDLRRNGSLLLIARSRGGQCVCKDGGHYSKKQRRCEPVLRRVAILAAKAAGAGEEKTRAKNST